MSQQFRKLLQIFYIKINTSAHADVYKKLLADQFDQAEAQPIHVLSINSKPSIHQTFNKKQDSRPQILYRNSDFASTFLFSFILNLLKKGQNQYLNQFKKRVLDNLNLFYRQQQSDDSIKYKFIFDGIFQFCEHIISRQYKKEQIQKLYQSFYINTFQRRGLKKTQKQKFLIQSQTILTLILGKAGNFPSKKDVSQPTSDVYELNSLQFSINIWSNDQQKPWLIGEGQNQINITKQKNQYIAYQQKNDETYIQQQEMNQAWQNILNQSKQISKQQIQKTAKIFTQLNLVQVSSPNSRSLRSPKSVQIKNGLNRQKNIGNFF